MSLAWLAISALFFGSKDELQLEPSPPTIPEPGPGPSLPPVEPGPGLVELGPTFFEYEPVAPYSEPMPEVLPTAIIRTELAQGDVVLEPRQPYYEEKLVATYPELIQEIRKTRVTARREAGIIQPEYEAPPMPREAGPTYGDRVSR